MCGINIFLFSFFLSPLTFGRVTYRKISCTYAFIRLIFNRFLFAILQVEQSHVVIKSYWCPSLTRFLISIRKIFHNWFFDSSKCLLKFMCVSQATKHSSRHRPGNDTFISDDESSEKRWICFLLFAFFALNKKCQISNKVETDTQQGFGTKTIRWGKVGSENL